MKISVDDARIELSCGAFAYGEKQSYLYARLESLQDYIDESLPIIIEVGENESIEDKFLEEVCEVNNEWYGDFEVYSMETSQVEEDEL